MPTAGGRIHSAVGGWFDCFAFASQHTASSELVSSRTTQPEATTEINLAVSGSTPILVPPSSPAECFADNRALAKEEQDTSQVIRDFCFALYPTSHCTCCPLRPGHIHARKCANLRYKKFDPADRDRYESVYGADADMVWFSLIVDDIAAYTRILREECAWAQVEKAMKVLYAAEKLFTAKLHRATRCRGRYPGMWVRKCLVCRVPAPSKWRGEGCVWEATRRILARCRRDDCCICHRRQPQSTVESSSTDKGNRKAGRNREHVRVWTLKEIPMKGEGRKRTKRFLEWRKTCAGKRIGPHPLRSVLGVDEE